MPLIKLFWDICWFQKGPQDTPASSFLLMLAMLAYLLVGAALTGLEAQWPEGLLQVLLEASMLLGFVWISVVAAGKTNRWLQTSVAMLGTDALISAIAIPLEGILLFNPQADLVYLLMLLLILWHIGVVAHILRHALSQTITLGLALAIVYVFFSLQVLILLFGPPSAPS
jgi:hypothetical protein